MGTSAVAKWLRYYDPLFRGRFDFSQSAAGPAREAWHQGFGLTGGRFWVRLRGGHDLRRRDARPVGSSACDSEPAFSEDLASAGVLVGRADGKTAAVTTFPWAGHPPGANHIYALTVMGAGGVPDALGAPEARAEFDAAGALLDPAPNAVSEPSVEALSAGRFRLRWTYDETDEEAPPSEFRVFNDAGSPGVVDFGVVVGTSPYQLRQGFFEWTSAPFAHDVRVLWSVTAATAAGVLGPASAAGSGVAQAALPLAPAGIRAVAGEEC